MDKATILAKLEERLALGEISEETYQQLRKKYEERWVDRSIHHMGARPHK